MLCYTDTMLCDYHANQLRARANPDADIRALERAAKQGDIAAAQELYAYWVRTQTVPTMFPKLTHQIQYEGYEFPLTLFNPAEYRGERSLGGADFLSKKTKLEALLQITVAEDISEQIGAHSWQVEGGHRINYWFKLINGKLEAKHILNDKDRVIQSKLKSYLPFLQGLFLTVRQWSMEHSEEIAEAQQAWANYRFQIHHERYQKAQLQLQKIQQDLGPSIVDLLKDSKH